MDSLSKTSGLKVPGPKVPGSKVPGSKIPGWVGVVIAAGIFFVVALGISLHRHFTFYSSYDQGIFNQVFWNGLQGNWFESSLSSQLSTNVVHSGEVPAVDYHRLGQHFTPILLLWLPLYALFPDPATLSVLQVTLVTGAGVVLYFLARHYLEPRLSLWILVSYYGAIATLGPTLNNFHDICQTPLLVFGILLAMEKRWWWLFGTLSVLLLGVREDSGITLFGIGSYLVVSRRYPRLGLALCTASFVYVMVLTNFIMPLFSDDIAKRFMLERFGQYASGDEATTWDILVGMLSQPWLIVMELFSPVGATLKYLLGQWLPFALIPAIAPGAWLVAGFPLLKLLLGKGVTVLTLNVRYALSVVPGLCYGTILWWAGQGVGNFYQPLEQQAPRRLRPGFRRFWRWCIGLSLVLCLISSPARALYFVMPDSFSPWVYVSAPEQWQRSTAMRQMLKQIPPDASVSATTYLIPSLSGRREVIRVPGVELRNDQQEQVFVDYVIADLWRLQRYQVAFKHDRSRLITYTELIDRLVATQQYGIIDYQNGVVLLQRAVAGEVRASQDWFAYREQLP